MQTEDNNQNSQAMYNRIHTPFLWADRNSPEMTEAKVPENGNDWKSIDIFLFSNGQQFSPPRKYHLVTQQLNWWNTTLNFLAKAQYGSL